MPNQYVGLFSVLKATTALCLGVIASGAPLIAMAADSLEKVTVTAQRREQTLQKVPLAVSVFRTRQLETLAITNTLDLSRQVPNVFAMNNTGLGSANAYYLRGLGNTETIATFDPPVGSYIDDIYISRQNANNFAFFDLERVEVLRGPQGTLFGRNTTGGAVNMILRAPGDTFSASGGIGLGEYGKISARGSVDIPISEHLRTKFSAYGNSRDGYADNVRTGGNDNEDESWGVRAAFEADLGSTLMWRGSVARMSNEAMNLPTTLCNPLVPTQCDGHYTATGLTDPLNSPTGLYQTAIPVSGAKAAFGLGNDTKTTLITSNLRWEMNEDTAVSFITGYIDLNQKFGIDFFDGRANAPGFTFAGAVPVPTFSAAQINPPLIAGTNPNGSFVIANDGSHKQFTQEVKVVGSLFAGAIDYVGGLYYIDEQNRTDFADIFGALGVPSPVFADRILSNDTDAWAIYFQGDWHITDTLTATLGARFTDETKDVAFFDNRPACQPNQAAVGCVSSVNIINAVFPSGARIPLSQNTQMTTPRFALSWQAQENVMVFASATNGFKSGGWNARATSATTMLPFSPEKVWSYEAGVRSDWWDGRLRLNATYFHNDTKDLQTPSAFVNPVSGAISFITRNFADFENDGLEVELLASVAEGLTVFANLGLQDARYEINRSAPTLDPFNILSVNAQQLNCQAALAGLAAVGIVDPRTPAQRAQSFCGTGIVTPQGLIAQPVRTPDVTISAGINYEFTVDGIGKILPSLAVTFIDETEVQTSNVTIFSTGPGTFSLNGGTPVWGSRSDGAMLLTASLGWESPSGKFRGYVQCTNCTDEAYVQSTLSNFNYYNQPRMWSLSLSAMY